MTIIRWMRRTTTGRCRIWVKRRNTRCEQMSSALAPTPDIAQQGRHICSVPGRDSCTRTATTQVYSFTLSARNSKPCGIERPIELAVMRSTTNSPANRASSEHDWDCAPYDAGNPPQVCLHPSGNSLQFTARGRISCDRRSMDLDVRFCRVFLDRLGRR